MEMIVRKRTGKELLLVPWDSRESIVESVLEAWMHSSGTPDERCEGCAAGGSVCPAIVRLFPLVDFLGDVMSHDRISLEIRTESGECTTMRLSAQNVVHMVLPHMLDTCPLMGPVRSVPLFSGIPSLPADWLVRDLLVAISEQVACSAAHPAPAPEAWQIRLHRILSGKAAALQYLCKWLQGAFLDGDAMINGIDSAAMLVDFFNSDIPGFMEELFAPAPGNGPHVE